MLIFLGNILFKCFIFALQRSYWVLPYVCKLQLKKIGFLLKFEFHLPFCFPWHHPFTACWRCDLWTPDLTIIIYYWGDIVLLGRRYSPVAVAGEFSTGALKEKTSLTSMHRALLLSFVSKNENGCWAEMWKLSFFFLIRNISYKYFEDRRRESWLP